MNRSQHLFDSDLLDHPTSKLGALVVACPTAHVEVGALGCAAAEPMLADIGAGEPDCRRHRSSA
jgi:hypothetical protein